MDLSATHSDLSSNGRIGPEPRYRLDSDDAVAGLGMIEQDSRSGMGAARDPRQDFPERAGIAADRLHQCHAIAVRGGFHLAGIARLEEGLGGKHDCAAADEVAEQHAEQH